MYNNIKEVCPLTLNTTRVCSTTAVDASVEVSKIAFTHMKPNAVILVNKNEVFDAIAAAPLVHMPINGSILFTDGNRLSKETLIEINRLCPKGYKGVHVILVGNISNNVAMELNNYGLRTYRISGRNSYETACKIPNIIKYFENILIISGENFSEGIMSSYLAAHHGDPILYVKKDSIPGCTIEAIKKMHDINVYIVGSTKTISKAVEENLSKLDNIKNLNRIDGENPYEIAVNFAKYKDPKTKFGWGRNYIDGHAFTFGTLSHPMHTLAGILFAHMGKHTPLLLISDNTVPPVVEKYIKLIKPIPPKDMPRPPFMHGFIVGDTSHITHAAQVKIEDVLSIDHEMMEMNNMSHNINEAENLSHTKIMCRFCDISDIFD